MKLLSNKFVFRDTGVYGPGEISFRNRSCCNNKRVVDFLGLWMRMRAKLGLRGIVILFIIVLKKTPLSS